MTPQTQKKLDRLTGTLGVDVIHELGAVPGPLLHADALRTTYGRVLRYGLDFTKYMRLQETWGGMTVKILCGDFYQLPPVPASASLLAPHTGQSYEHQQGRKFHADFEHVVDFVQMQRFTDPLQLEVLNAMRTPGGKKITDERWRAIVKTEVVSFSGAGRPAASSSQAAQQPQWDRRLREVEACTSRRTSGTSSLTPCMRKTKLDVHDAGQLLFYVPVADRPAARLAKPDFDEMRAESNIGATARMPGLLPLFVGMEVTPTESVLPRKWSHRRRAARPLNQMVLWYSATCRRPKAGWPGHRGRQDTLDRAAQEAGHSARRAWNEQRTQASSCTGRFHQDSRRSLFGWPTTSPCRVPGASASS